MLTVFCSVLAFHWMMTYQPRVAAARAALIYLLEPVFASCFSILWGLDDLTLRLLLGGGLIMGGNLLVELPGWLKSRNK
jgi:drug/metabolite transporter (DMT)-like permease